jgi:hypothetical protein
MLGSEITRGLEEVSIKGFDDNDSDEDRPRESKSDRKARKALERLQQEELKRAEKLMGLLNLKKVPTRYKERFAARWHENHRVIFRFLLTRVAPLELAFEPAIADTTEAIRMMTGSDDVEIGSAKARQIFNDLIELKMLQFLAKQMHMPKELRQKVIDRHFQPASGDGTKRHFAEILTQLAKTQQANKPATTTPARATVAVPPRSQAKADRNGRR